MLDLTPNVMVFWDGALEQCLGHEGGFLLVGVSTKHRAPACCLFSVTWSHHKTTAICKPGGESSPDTGSLLPWTWTSWPPELWGVDVCWFSHPAYDVLFQQPEMIKTGLIHKVGIPKYQLEVQESSKACFYFNLHMKSSCSTPLCFCSTLDTAGI